MSHRQSRKAADLVRGLVVFLLCLFPLASMAAELSSQVGRTQISQNETLSLVIEYSAQADTRELDLSGLEQDFEILGNSTQSSVSIVNGRQTVSTRWNLVLLPRRTGTLLIPSFQLNGDFSQAVEIEVSESAPQGERSRPLNVEMSLSDQQVFAQQQLVLTLRLIAASSVSNLTGDSLDVPGAAVQLLSQDRYAEMVDGANWQVIEWRYALFFDEPGEYEIPAQVFSGLSGASRSVFDPFGTSGERVIARASQQRVQVQPAPRAQGWLPADDLIIRSVWPSGAPSIRVGEPVTRQVIVQVKGQRPEVIPPLPEPNSGQIRQYADQPQLSSESQNGVLISQRIESAALVATSEGEYQLPEVRIPWWDQQEAVWKEAVLPAETLLVRPAAPVESLAVPTQPNPAAPSQVVVQHKSGYWPWVSAGLALLVVLLLLDRLRLIRNTRTVSDPRAQSSNSGESRAFQQVGLALKANDAAAALAALQNWMACEGAVVSNLSQLKCQLPAPASEELEKLLQRQFSVHPGEPVDTKNLLEALKTLRQAGADKSSGRGELKPLYPTREA